MLSFAQTVREEILKKEIKKKEMASFQLCGIVSFIGNFSDGGCSIVSKKQELLVNTSKIARWVLGKESCELLGFTLNFSRTILGDLSKLVNTDFENADQMRYFLRGAYLASGSATNPEKQYHLEFVTDNENAAKKLTLCLEAFDTFPKTIMRKERFVVYLKNSDEIETVLGMMSAHNAMMDFLNAKIIKEKRNEVNRQVNFETANMEKTVSAAVEQIQMIEKIEKKLGIEALPDDLAELAVLRKSEPDASLADLAQKLSLSKSGVNHRIRRIKEFAERI